MKTFRWQFPGWRPLILTVAATIIVAVIGGFLLAWSGLYNVAAGRDHLPITRTILEFALRSAVRTQSLGISAPALDDIDLIRLGAGHFPTGCAVCHGAPGEPTNPLFAQMLPAPPSLAEAAPKWDASQLFWIVKHGFKYTGMPAWVAPERDDEVWAVVAFLQRIPNLGAKEYRELASIRDRDAAAAELVRFGKVSDTSRACARCHEDEESTTKSRLIPKLAGQSNHYLQSALRGYSTGARPSGIMQQIAARLDGDEIRQLSAYYSSLTVKREEPTQPVPSVSQLERGRQIAEAGVPAEGIPPCAACHGQKARETFPKLAGQHARYVEGQLNLWKEGLRDGTVTGAVMAPIARRLTGQQIQDVALYYETLPQGLHGTEGALRAVPP